MFLVQHAPKRLCGARSCALVSSSIKFLDVLPIDDKFIPPRKCHSTLANATAPTTIMEISHPYKFQVRFFDSRKRKLKPKKKGDPFRMLGVKKGSKYKDVKREFLKIAMNNHPDTATATTEDERDKMRDLFISARMAFEDIAEGDDGIAVIKEDVVEDAESNFDSWFKSETGLETPFQFDMDPETMKEVAKMTDELGGGLDRDGGMWTLAKMVTSAVKSGGEAGSILRLETGEIKNEDRRIDGVLRRRRRR